MKNLIQFLGITILTVGSLIATYSCKQAPLAWELLGTKSVGFLIDRDEIEVTKAQGYFTALKLKVTQSALNVHKMLVHFADGSTQDVALQDEMAAGQESRVIDLPGNKRVITKVVFWYDTKDDKESKAVVELWGRH
jgi:hypothetical protein